MFKVRRAREDRLKLNFAIGFRAEIPPLAQTNMHALPYWKSSPPSIISSHFKTSWHAQLLS
jgi:hypothetical protein